MSFGNIANSGIKAALSAMEVVSNNIANVNTLGFKKSFVNFADIYMGGAGASQSTGLGTKINSIQQDFTTGRIDSSTSGLDMRLNGEGFFIQKDQATGSISYTRAGHFQIDNQGNLVGAGGVIQGYPASKGVVLPTGQLVNMNISPLPMQPSATSNVNYAVNLNTTAQPPVVTTFDPANAESYNYASAPQTVYDSLGNASELTVYYVNTGVNAWNANVVVNGALVGTGTVQFDGSGALSSTTGLSGLNWTHSNGASSPQVLNLNLKGSTQFSSANNTITATQDGHTTGLPQDVSIDASGNMSVYYTNGLTQIQGQLAVAKFAAPQGLTKADDLSWIPSSSSGAAIVNPSASENNFVTNSLENSNVDLTDELVNLISNQQWFQANAQATQVYNQVMQTIGQL